MTTTTTPSTESGGWDVSLTSRAERSAAGKALRSKTPRSSHAAWSPDPERPDPISLLEEANKTRVEPLVPIRFGRMSLSPFAFYRGSADLMAHDLATTPISGIKAQLCGDAHLSNFGVYASPERRQVFDLNDFDETLPGPWEWDVKRLAASVVLAGRQNGYSPRDSKQAVLRCLQRYRESMGQFAQMNHLDVWYSHLEVEGLIALTRGKKLKRGMERKSERASKRTRIETFPKLAEVVDGQYRIKDEPPLIFHYGQWDTGQDQLDTEQLRAFVLDYLASLPQERRILISRYQALDLAHKVVGQRMMQAASDILLGWSTLGGRDYYVRQLRDMKWSAEIETMNLSEFSLYVELCAATLARAHARTSDPAQISGYLGNRDTFDQAIASFAEVYADQAERDHAALLAAIKEGRVLAQIGV